MCAVRLRLLHIRVIKLEFNRWIFFCRALILWTSGFNQSLWQKNFDIQTKIFARNVRSLVQRNQCLKRCNLKKRIFFKSALKFHDVDNLLIRSFCACIEFFIQESDLSPAVFHIWTGNKQHTKANRYTTTRELFIEAAFVNCYLNTMK